MTVFISKIRDLSAKCSLLRQVCALNRPKGAKPLSSALSNPLPQSRFHLLAAKAVASILALGLSLSSPALASEQGGWNRSRNRGIAYHLHRVKL